MVEWKEPFKGKVRKLEEGEWELLGEISQDNKQRLAFYDNLAFESYQRKIKCEFIVLLSEGKLLICRKRQIVTYDQKPL